MKLDENQKKNVKELYAKWKQAESDSEDAACRANKYWDAIRVFGIFPTSPPTWLV